MRILVTGGAGFVGSNFVEFAIHERGYEVVTLDALTYAGSPGNLNSIVDHPRHRFVRGDIGDADLVRNIVPAVDAIINFAAETHVDRSIEDCKTFIETNVGGTQTLLDAALDAGVDRFLQVSTDEVYGQIHEGSFDEDDRLNPRNPYAATKASADLLAESYGTTYDFPVLITRSCNNFGPRQHAEKLIPKFVKRSAAGDSLPLYGDGSNVREWIYVEDNCRALDLVLRSGTPGEIYNVGTGEERTNLEVTRAILNAVGGSEEQIRYVEDRAGHDQRYALNSDKIQRLGWKPQWTFEEGLKAVISFYV